MTRSTRRGPTTGQGRQLEITWSVPEATPATTDFVCWLWAAFPPRNGKLDVARIAKALGVSTTTIRRWITTDDPKLVDEQVAKVHQRAILRGRGRYLWPDLDLTSQRRAELQYATAVRNNELVVTEPDRITPEWRRNGTLAKHEVHIVYWDRAHAYGVAMTTHPKAKDRISRRGTILETTVVDNKYAAIVLKHEILARRTDHRCITPRHLVPTGRTETWRERGGATTIRRPLEVQLVRFAGLPSFDEVDEVLRSQHPHIEFTTTLARDADQACEALTRPADVAILSTHGYTRATWDSTATPWPGGRWYAGHKRRAGMSLPELVDGVRGRGGFQTPMLVIDTCEATQTRAPLLRLTERTDTQILLKTPGTDTHSEIAELSTLLGRLDLERQSAKAPSRGLRHYRP